MVTEAKIADLLLDKPDGLHVDELAKKSGLDAGKLGRILRVLATQHTFKEGARLFLMSSTLAFDTSM